MHSSFYNMAMTGMDFQDKDEKTGQVVSQLNIKNILELSNQDMAVVEQLRKFMHEQADELEKEIDRMQLLMVENAMKPQEEEDDDDLCNSIPTEKELRNYSSKL